MWALIFRACKLRELSDYETIEVSAAEIVPGQFISDCFVILRSLGSGGRATVYLARDEQLQQEVAIKVWHRYLNSDAVNQERFRREARIAAKLEHPYIVKVRSFGHHGDVPFLVMEYVDGVSLDQYLQKHGTLDLPAFTSIFTALANALSYAHGNHVLHRDVKPANIVVNENELEHPKLVDFGMARLMEEEGGQHLTRTSTVAGSPAYMSPEQCQGKSVDVRSDIYSLGATMFEALTAQHVFIGESELAVMSRHVTDEPVFPETSCANEFVKEIVLKCLKKNPDERYQSASELEAALRGIDTQKLSLAKSKEQQKSKSSPIIVRACTAALCVVTGAIGAIGFLNTKSHEAKTEISFASKSSQLHPIGAEQRSARSLYSDAVSLWGTGPPEKVIHLLELSTQVARKNNELSNAIDAQTTLAEFFTSQGQQQKARKVIDEVLLQASRHSPLAPGLESAIFGAAARIYLRDKDYDKGELFLKKGLAAAEGFAFESDRNWRVARSLEELADFYHYRGRDNLAAACLKRAIDEYSGMPETASRIAALMSYSMNRDPVTFKFAEARLNEVFRSPMEDHGTASRLRDIAVDFARKKNFQGAHHFAELCLNCESPEELIQTLLVLAEANFKAGDNARAIKYCKEALDPANAELLKPKDKLKFELLLSQTKS